MTWFMFLTIDWKAEAIRWPTMCDEGNERASRPTYDGPQEPHRPDTSAVSPVQHSSQVTVSNDAARAEKEVSDGVPGWRRSCHRCPMGGLSRVA